MCDFSYNSDKFTSAEQFMMHEKALIFEDYEIAKKIIREKSPKVIKNLGRKVKGFDDKVWNKHKYIIVLNSNYAKFSQSQYLREYLLSLKKKVLVEASPYDKIWGIGISESDKNILNPYSWKGENLLGFALMEVLSDIEKVYKNYYKINWEQLEKDNL